ncbi:nitrate reductase [Pontibacter sp. G13]|uniref:molybdopterin oxidoreductase family protein n=1 Tax=Pontibacter sp. G13 TaxID=3074898 RepID=UPI00288BCC23|nr:nitrate reductase [Pontibacter sp. G13]WNJ17915.1 nitrate reductase [Pontibacter sp. G13]
MKDQKDPDYIEDKDIHKLNRRSFVKLAGGIVAVGALTGTGWAVTELSVKEGPVKSWHKSVCRYCGTGCGVMLGLDKKKNLVRVRGDQEAHNKGVICIKGSLLAELMNDKEARVAKPMVRIQGKLRESTWEEAMEIVADKFRETIDQHGPESVAFYGSGQLFIEESYTANKLFKGGIGSNNVDGNPRLCMASAAFGYTQVFGKDEPAGCFDDIDHADVFFLIGSNAYEAHPPIFERMMRRKAANPDTKIIVVDPRRTKTAEHADFYLPVIPGTDMLLLNSMLQVIVAEGLYSQEYVDNHITFMDGEKEVSFDQYKKFLEDYAPEKVAAELGISAPQIRETAYYFAHSKATMSMWTMGLNQRVQGVFLNNNMNALHLITGQINKPGATPMSLTGQSNACGGVRDTGSLAHLLPNGRLIAKPKHREEVEQLWGIPKGKINPKPGYDALSLFQAMNDDKVKAVLVMCTNPAQSLPNVRKYLPGMEKQFMVVADAFADSETLKYADVVLPAALYIEKEGVYGQTERRYQLIEQLVEPYEEARSDLAILVDLAERLGYGDLIKSKTSAEVWDEYRKFSASSFYNFEGMTRERLQQERGLQWPCPTEDHPGTARRYIQGDPFVPEGKSVMFYGKPNGKATVFLRPYKRGKEVASLSRPTYLTTGRVVSQWHTGTMTRNVKELNTQSGPGRFVFHPQDAAHYHVKDGDEVVVTSSRGEMKGIVSVSEFETPGVIFASFFDPKLMVNDVVSDDNDPISKQPDYKVTAVSISKTSNSSQTS